MRIPKHSGRLNCNAVIAGRCIVCNHTDPDTMVRVETHSCTDTNTMVRVKIEWTRKQDTDDRKTVQKKDNAKRYKAIRTAISNKDD